MTDVLGEVVQTNSGPDQHAFRASATPPRGSGRGVLPLERAAVRKLLEGIGRPPLTFVLWNGEEISCSPETPVARIVIREPAALHRLVLDPELNFGDEYAAGRIDVQGDLAAMAETVLRYNPAPAPAGLVPRRLLGWLHRPHDTTLGGSRENIHRHYDLGNHFYRLWLDEDLVYTCAYFDPPGISLERAQAAKMEHVCRKLRLRPGLRVVEAGCGWGALARFMARVHGVHVTAYNISREQVRYARERARAEGLDGRVEFIEDDYRNIRGEFDVFVSVGMLEHVGLEHFGTLGRVIQGSLKDEGLALIHTIGRNRPAALNAWIERRIFPGAYPPSLSEMAAIFEPYDFSVLDVENLRLHYAETLDHWLRRFDAARGSVASTHGEEFVRAWRFYLAGSRASFQAGVLQLFQVTFAHGSNNRVPRTRRDLYETVTGAAEDDGTL